MEDHYSVKKEGVLNALINYFWPQVRQMMGYEAYIQSTCNLCEMNCGQSHLALIALNALFWLFTRFSYFLQPHTSSSH